MKPNMIKKWSIALLVAAGAAGLTGCEGMRVDEGASTATNSGNIEDRNVLKANLSGTVVDDFGGAISGVTIYAYGQSTTTDDGGNWILNNVPVTGVNINSTPQNLEQTTDVVSQGNIYISYNKAGYAEYRSRISNPAVVTHYGTAGGNPNSIVVDGLMASEAIQLPQLINTITGVLIDKGTYYTGTIGKYERAAGKSVRLVPATDVVNNAYDSAATTCYEGCGFYSVDEIQATTAADGTFEFKNVPKIPGGYIMRIDDPRYRPMARPNDGTGFSYDYDAGTTGTLANADSTWGVSVQAHENQNYWWGIDFDVKTQSGATTYLDALYVGDFLVAANNYVEGITVGGKYGYPDEPSGETSDDGHNPLDLAGNPAADTDPNNDNIIDSNIVDLGVTPLKFIFSGDMVPQTGSEIPARGIVIFDNDGNELAWKSTDTGVDGRTLTLQLASTPTAGKTIYVRLHRDVFTSMTGQRLIQTVDPNEAQFSDTTTPPDGSTSDPANDNGYYTEYEIQYIDPLITADPVEGVAQSSIDRAIPLTSKLPTASATDTTNVLFSLQAKDFRIEELVDAVLFKTSKGTVVNLDGDTDTEFSGTTANISFTAVNGGKYRITVLDDDGVALAIANAAAGVATEADATDTTDAGAGAAFSLAVGTANTSGSSFIDFTASVGSGTTDATAKIQLTNVAAGYKVTIARINDFGDVISASASQTITLADDFEPHVAIQNSNHNGQDTLFRGNDPTGGAIAGLGTVAAGGAVTSAMTAEMLFECGIETSDDNGEQEIGDAAYYFPKLNLSASLYDKSKLRSLTEVSSPADLLSTAMDQGQTDWSRAEDFNNAVTPSLIANALITPLLATEPATEASAGKTDNTSRSDRYYNAADYDGWGLQTSTSASDTCKYYTAAYDTNTGDFLNRWDEANKVSSTSATLVAPVVTANSIADPDSSAATSPSADYAIVTGLVRSVSIAGGTSTVSAPTIEGPTGCRVAASTSYDFARTAVLNMTEAVAAPANLATFKAETGVCGQTNIASGSDLDASGTGLTAIAGPSSGYNDDHLLLTFGDWRTIDGSDHFIDKSQNAIANSIADGSSLGDLMQIVSLQDASGLAATAGNGRGVLIVDATPPMATVMSHNGSSITIKFDQSISLADLDANANNQDFEFELVGEGNVRYQFELGENTSDLTQGTVRRSTAYIDRYGADAVVASQDVDITVTAGVNTDDNVPSGNANSMLTITVVDPSTTAGQSSAAIRAVDFSDYFNELSYGSAAAAIGSNTVTETAMGTPAGTANDVGFYMDYAALQDNNFNSWDQVETYDQYDGANSPRLLGADGQGPRLSISQLHGTNASLSGTPGTAADVSTRDADATYLHLSSGITVTSIHATAAADADTVYTGSTTGAITTNDTDTELGYVYGYVNGTVAAVDSNVRLVVKTSNTDLDIAEAVAYIYNPDFTGAGTNVGLTGGTIIVPTDANAAGGTTYSHGGATSTGTVAIDAANDSGTTLIVELPDLAAVPTVGDQIVIQNVVSSGHVYSIHIPIPAARALTTGGGTAPSTTEAGITSLNPVVYKHVHLDNVAAAATNNVEDVSAIQTSTAITTATGNIEIQLPFRERLASTVSGSWTRGDDDDQAAADGTVNFAVAGAVAGTSATGGADPRMAVLTLNGNTASSNPVTEGTTRYVGHDAQLSASVSDHSGNISTVNIKLQKGHGAAVGNNVAAGENTDAILNIISGSAID